MSTTENDRHDNVMENTLTLRKFMHMYSLAIYIFELAIKLASLFNKKIALLNQGHKGLFERMSRDIVRIRNCKPDSRTYLFHCASLGEFEQGRPVIEALRKKEPEAIIILTFFSPSGYEPNKNNELADAVYYLPFDTRWEASKFASIIKADVAIVIKYEYWRNIFNALTRNGAALYIISALFQEDMCFFKWYGTFFRRPLGYVSHFFVQDENSVSLLKSIGFSNATISGDTRFDRVIKITENEPSQRIVKLEKYIDNDRKRFVAGSVWESDMKRLIPFISCHREIQFIIAPHNIDNNQIDRWISLLPSEINVAKFTEIENIDSTTNYDVVFINCVGMLSQVYKFASLAFIGGGYDKLGIHNTLEPAVWYKPVIFGPVFSRYIEAVGLVKCGGAFVVPETNDIETYWKDFLINGDIHAKKAGDFVQSNSGVTEKILNLIA